MSRISKTQSRTSLKSANKESQSLEISSIIDLFEIDISDILFDLNIIESIDTSIDGSSFFRFHNNPILINQNITWRDKVYYPLPIKASEFAQNGDGRLPKPKLAMSVNEAGLSVFSDFKTQLSIIGDLAGAKVTRYRTFASKLAESNFPEGLPVGFEPDENSELSREVFYVERKTREDKYTLEFELSSPLDFEHTFLPRSIITNDYCRFQYRGCGCSYEYSLRKNSTEHGNATLPTNARAVANSNDESILVLLNEDTEPSDPSYVSITDRGEWLSTIPYSKGDQVYITKNNINYYFVAKTSVDSGKIPPNSTYWIADVCSKKISGCKLRYATGTDGAEAKNGNLPIGSFKGVNRIR